jgi:hypothetical protein
MRAPLKRNLMTGIATAGRPSRQMLVARVSDVGRKVIHSSVFAGTRIMVRVEHCRRFHYPAAGRSDRQNGATKPGGATTTNRSGARVDRHLLVYPHVGHEIEAAPENAAAPPRASDNATSRADRGTTATGRTGSENVTRKERPIAATPARRKRPRRPRRRGPDQGWRRPARIDRRPRHGHIAAPWTAPAKTLWRMWKAAREVAGRHDGAEGERGGHRGEHALLGLRLQLRVVLLDEHLDVIRHG